MRITECVSRRSNLWPKVASGTPGNGVLFDNHGMNTNGLTINKLVSGGVRDTTSGRSF